MSGPIELGDWGRILRGDNPWSFLLEAILRIAVLYVLLLVSLRVMGRRMSSQLSRNELLALVSLAAAIGPAMQSPDQGLLPPLIIAIWVVSFQRVIAFATFRSQRFEDAMNGVVTPLVSAGRVDLARLRSEAISLERLRSQLRVSGILNLGKVERVYFEPGGAFSVVSREQEQPGLSLAPSWDPELRARQKDVPGAFACSSCGNVVESKSMARCPACQSMPEWLPAVCGRYDEQQSAGADSRADGDEVERSEHRG
jgi:uncharacterized membrane protein YcaP (DUF421 family)